MATDSHLFSVVRERDKARAQCSKCEREQRMLLLRLHCGQKSHALTKNPFDKSASAALYSPTTSHRSTSTSGDRNFDVCGSEFNFSNIISQK